MFTLTSPSEASRKATKQASRVMSSLKNTFWSTFYKTPKQHLKEQKPKYQLCSNPSITITDAETGEEWDLVDHDELDGDLANSDDNRISREELEMNAREQEDLLHPRHHFHPDSLRSATINTNLPTPTTHPTLDALHDNLLRYPQDSPATDITKHYPTHLTLDATAFFTVLGLFGYDNTKHTNTPTHQPTDSTAIMGMQMPSDPSLKWPAECTKPSMFSMLIKKVTTLIKGPSDEEKDRDLKESTVIHPEDATEPWELIPTIKDDPWTVVVKSRSMLGEFKDGNGDRQSHYERTYQYEFDRQVVVADRLALREAKMHTAK
ncbi:hypothetical protein FOPG_10294 [Fusarium oxysporum f. sp. conglutinans race 2 54008]|uniref:Uncharacterized protein n=3 Tax=Fusarium oxysporum f. sp. conglutinans TaxID=100902 RepID=A0A8H6GNZ0_FUSOX|nr:hypothetical protein FOXB_02764 [Fusarium oxysporum f. sp. conglutinans Fo5176]EXL74697.1 hypothetical protein FOPG_10294 [Fusarium oxysporum f. sp. conglutinans race 2 54008]KAF6521559.1 hypothetical protein HZS61_015817 [Fusarium oxysporum f. sp. conglutinans]KAG6999019.1 hypothetical protein FocnCong_v013723 [Fusarium oxysporum f. sp. conglutinans]